MRYNSRMERQTMKVRKQERIKVYLTGSRKTIEYWIKNRGGVNVWRGVGRDWFMPVRDANGRRTHDPHWFHGKRKPVVVTNIARFKFAKELREVRRLSIRDMRVGGDMRVTLGRSGRVVMKKALAAAGPDAAFRFDYVTSKFVIELPVWEDDKEE
jgi:hypothetical protein